MNAGDKINYNTGQDVGIVEGEVVSINGDGSLNIVYPHPLNADVLATADSVQRGKTAYRWTPVGGGPEPEPEPEPKAPAKAPARTRK